jgi:hypothetical protein
MYFNIVILYFNVLLVYLWCIFLYFSIFFYISIYFYGSNINSIFAIINELELFFLMTVLIQNFNTLDLVKFLQKNQNFTFRL